jgi:alkylhydroperoxidase family enzyme
MSRLPRLAAVSRYDELIARLREAAQPDRPAPPEFASYLAKVRRGAYAVTDQDVEELKAAGFSEDEIFEHTVSAAVAAGLERLEAGLGAMR